MSMPCGGRSLWVSSFPDPPQEPGTSERGFKGEYPRFRVLPLALVWSRMLLLSHRTKRHVFRHLPEMTEKQKGGKEEAMSREYDVQSQQFLRLLSLHETNIEYHVQKGQLHAPEDLEMLHRQAKFLLDRYLDLKQRGVF